MAALEEGSSVDFVVKISDLSRSTVLKLKNQVEQKRLAGLPQGLPSKGI